MQTYLAGRQTHEPIPCLMRGVPPSRIVGTHSLWHGGYKSKNSVDRIFEIHYGGMSINVA